MAGLANLGGSGFLPGLSGFNIPEISGGHGPLTSALGFGGLPQPQNGAYPESNPYLEFFGMPMKNGRIVDAPPQNREHFDWAEAYDKASVPYLTAFTITKLTEADTVLCRTVLPFVVTEDRIDIKWSEWHFRDAMLDPRPAETASRLLSCNFTQGSDTMQTMGRAIEMEDGFFNTEAGKTHFKMQLKQIINATSATLEFGAATALANVRQPGTSQTEQHRSGISPEQLRAIAIREIRLFNCITTPGGLDIAIEHCLTILTSRGVDAQSADTVIVPGGSEKHINDPTFKPFFLTGRQQPEHADHEVRYKNKRIITSRLHNVGGEGPPQDPHFSWVTTGTNYVSDYELTFGMDASEYRTTMRTEVIWNEDSDDYSHVSLEHMIRYSGLFRTTGEGRWLLSDQIGEPFFAGCGTIGDYYDMQGKTIRLSEDHYHNDELETIAGLSYQADTERNVQGNRPLQEQYEQAAAHLNPMNCPGDEFFTVQGYPENSFFTSSRELIDRIMDTDIQWIGLWFQWCVAAHVPIPISFIMANPYQRWYAGMLQTMKSGTDLGGTFIGHFDMQAGRDYVKKMLGLHVTAMMKSIVINPKLIANAPNVLVKGYDGGGGIRPWDPLDADHVRDFKRGNTQNNDQFIFAVNNIKPYWCTDLCGFLNPDIVIDNETRDIHATVAAAMDRATDEANGRRPNQIQRRSNDTFLRDLIRQEQDLARGAALAGADFEGLGDAENVLVPGSMVVAANFFTGMAMPIYPRRVRNREEQENRLQLFADMRRMHYSSALIYSNFWGFEHTPGVTPTTVAATVRPKTNTLCFPGHQFSAEATTGKHSFVRIDKGHRSPYVYPGCGKVRTGLEISLRQPAYIGSAMSTMSTLVSTSMG